MTKPIRIATRTSALALWQAEEVKRQLLALEPSLSAELVLIHSDGDLVQTQGFDQFGYKGIFTKRIEAALLDGRADIAVHSMKDVHSELPDSLFIAATLQREDPRDAFISARYASLAALPAGATVGTASVRRQAVLKSLRPDLNIVSFRGNVPTRLEKLQRGEVDATFLAVAGLKRLGLAQHITQPLPFEVMLPAVAQGAVGIECRRDDVAICALLERINHQPTFLAVNAERAMLAVVDGDCHTPLCGHARIGDSGELSLSGIWYTLDGSQHFSVQQNGAAEQAEDIGRKAGEALKQQIESAA